MKLFKLAAWASGIMGVIIIILAAISLISVTTLFGFRHVVHYFTVANSFFLLAILCLLAYQGCKDK